MAQTSYAINIPAVSYPGQLANLMKSKIQTALAVAAAINYGTIVVRDASNTGTDYSVIAGKAPAASTDITVSRNILGIAVADQARAQNPDVAPAQYPINSAVPCLFDGEIWVVVESACVAGGVVYGRFATGDNGTVPGAIGGVLDTSVVGNAAMPGAVFKSTSASGGYAVVSILEA